MRLNAFTAPPEWTDGIGEIFKPAYLEFGHIHSTRLQPPTPPLWFNAQKLCQERRVATKVTLRSPALTAKVLGQNEVAGILLARSQNYTKLEPLTGFFRSRSLFTDVVLTDLFGQDSSGGDFMESGPWRYRLTAPHDPMGLKKSFLEIDNSLN